MAAETDARRLTVGQLLRARPRGSLSRRSPARRCAGHGSIRVSKFLSGTRRPTLMILKPPLAGSRRHAEPLDVSGLERHRDATVGNAEREQPLPGRRAGRDDPVGVAGQPAVQRELPARQHRVDRRRALGEDHVGAAVAPAPVEDAQRRRAVFGYHHARRDRPRAVRARARGATASACAPGAGAARSAGARPGRGARRGTSPAGRPSSADPPTGRSRRARAPGARSATGTAARGTGRVWAGRWRSAGPWRAEGYATTPERPEFLTTRVADAGDWRETRPCPTEAPFTARGATSGEILALELGAAAALEPDRAVLPVVRHHQRAAGRGERQHRPGTGGRAARRRSDR